MTYEQYFNSLSDSNLDAMIVRLIESSKKVDGENRQILEKLFNKANTEWRHRYPGTVCPSLHRKAGISGEYPECYSGPVITIEKDLK